MITPQGTVKVMDFGIARAVSDSAATMTSTAAVIGTAQYLSPEQARGEGVDARSDVYSMGCMLYELVTGAPPFTGDSPVSVAYQHVRDPRLPSSINRDIPAELDAILLKAMSKNPGQPVPVGRRHAQRPAPAPWPGSGSRPRPSWVTPRRPRSSARPPAATGFGYGYRGDEAGATTSTPGAASAGSSRSSPSSRCCSSAGSSPPPSPCRATPRRPRRRRSPSRS